MIDSLFHAKLPPKFNMARLQNGSDDKIVAHLERNLEFNALEESDDLPVASMTSSTTKTKFLLSTGQTTDITCTYCKEKGHMVKDCEKLEKKAKLPRRRRILSVALVARLITQKSDVGKAPVCISNLSAPDPRTHPTKSRLESAKAPI